MDEKARNRSDEQEKENPDAQRSELDTRLTLPFFIETTHVPEDSLPSSATGLTLEQDERVTPPVSAETAVRTGVWCERRFACAAQARTDVNLRRRMEDSHVDEWDEDNFWRELE